MTEIPPIPEHFTICKRHPGFVARRGKSTGIETNWYYDAIDEKTNEPCILMYCRPYGFTIIDPNTLSRIKEGDQLHVSWFIMSNGYVAGHVMTENGRKNICLHQYLMNYYGHGLVRGISTIDHINRNKLDNRMANLRIASHSEQIKNRGKMIRKHSAKPLPSEITQQDLPKFVVYYHEVHGKGTRDYFKVENHPLQLQKEREFLLLKPNNLQTNNGPPQKARKSASRTNSNKPSNISHFLMAFFQSTPQRYKIDNNHLSLF